MPWTSIAAGAASGIASSLLGGGSSGSNASKEISQYSAMNPLYYPVTSARKMGIHPLYALGVQGHQPISDGQSGAGNWLSDGIEGAVSAYQNRPTKAKPNLQSSALNAQQLQIGRAQAAKLQAETDFIHAQAQASKIKTASQLVNATQGPQKVAAMGGGPIPVKIGANTTMMLPPGSPTVENAENYLGEVGEALVTLNNLGGANDRLREGNRRRADLDREWKKEKVRQRRAGYVKNRRIYNWK